MTKMTKPATDLLPPLAMLTAACAMGHGAAKYARHNWLEAEAQGIYCGAALRHIFAWQAGENLDPESGIEHLAHAIASLSILLELQLRKVGKDDRPLSTRRTEASRTDDVIAAVKRAQRDLAGAEATVTPLRECTYQTDGHSYAPATHTQIAAGLTCERCGHLAGAEPCGHRHGRYGCTVTRCKYGEREPYIAPEPTVDELAQARRFAASSGVDLDPTKHAHHGNIAHDCAICDRPYEDHGSLSP